MSTSELWDEFRNPTGLLFVQPETKHWRETMYIGIGGLILLIILLVVIF